MVSFLPFDSEDVTMKTLKMTITAAVIAGFAALPMTAAHAWGNWGPYHLRLRTQREGGNHRTAGLPIDPCDHCAIINEKLFPIPLVTIALFIIPIATNRTPVKIDARIPNMKASAIREGPITVGLKSSRFNTLPINNVPQETTTSAAIAQDAA